MNGIGLGLMGTLCRPAGYSDSFALTRRRRAEDSVRDLSDRLPRRRRQHAPRQRRDPTGPQGPSRARLRPRRPRPVWKILEEFFAELGYRDYIGALQRYRDEHPREVELLSMSSFLMDYPFADRLFPAALEVLKRLRSFAPTVILSDGDVVFQPRKIEHAGLSDAVDGHVLIYIHKEEALDDIERRYPADHYVLVDDKLRILAAIKRSWGARVTTVLVRRGIYASDPKAVGAYPPADVSIERIGDLLGCDLPRLWSVPPVTGSGPEPKR